MTNKVYISGFAYEPGEILEPLGNLQEISDNPELVEHFRVTGLRSYCRTAKAPAELAESAIRRTLARIRTAPAQIDAVYYATNTFWDPKFAGQHEVCGLLNRLQMDAAYPYGITLSFCNGYMAALHAAWQAVFVGQHRNVLVVTTDRVGAEQSRVIEPRVSVASDIASCTLLSSEESSKYRLSCPVLRFNAKLGLLDPSLDFSAYMQGVAEGIVSTTTDTLSAAKCDLLKIEKVLTNNYNMWITPSMLKLVGIAPERVYLDNIPRFAHGGSSDIATNLAEFLGTPQGRDAGDLLLLATGPMMWGGTVLQTA